LAASGSCSRRRLPWPRGGELQGEAQALEAERELVLGLGEGGGASDGAQGALVEVVDAGGARGLAVEGAHALWPVIGGEPAQRRGAQAQAALQDEHLGGAQDDPRGAVEGGQGEDKGGEVGRLEARVELARDRFEGVGGALQVGDERVEGQVGGERVGDARGLLGQGAGPGQEAIQGVVAASVVVVIGQRVQQPPLAEDRLLPQHRLAAQIAGQRDHGGLLGEQQQARERGAQARLAALRAALEREVEVSPRAAEVVRGEVGHRGAQRRLGLGGERGGLLGVGAGGGGGALFVPQPEGRGAQERAQGQELLGGSQGLHRMSGGGARGLSRGREAEASRFCATICAGPICEDPALAGLRGARGARRIKTWPRGWE
jgi:hypothetical protein